MIQFRFSEMIGLGSFTAALLLSGTSGARAAETVWLSSLDLSSVDQGFGKPHVDHSVDGNPIRLGGRAFEHGLGTHSPGSFVLDLNGGSSRFTAWVGIDDEVGNRGTVQFQVIADGKMLWNSGVMRGGQAPRQVDLDTTGIRQLGLLVDDAGDGFEFDHAVWADAAFTVTGARPQPSHPAATTPSISMTAPPDSPHVTSPAVFGVMTGTPVLYNITATGKAPLTFSASGLPRGLNLDRATGQITGSIDRPGTHTITLTARNAAGKDSRKLRLIVGDTIALTPPLGWNSYDSFGDDVTESEVLANAHFLKEYLQPHGWQYVIVDYRWYDPGASKAPNNTGARAGAELAMDAYGRLEPAPNRFPSASGGKGFKPLADQMHAMGLLFGVHIMRGIPRQAVKANLPIEGSPYHAADAANTASTCGWCPDMYGVDTSKPAGQAWYDSILRQYAGWGLDYIKVDDMSSPYSAGEIAAVHKAIQRCGRSIVFSLSPGETPIEQAKHVQQNANLWRISGDFWDDWGAVSHQFGLIDRWKGNGGPGHWPDADMIPLGHLSIKNRSVGPDRHTNFTPNEQVTLISLWAMAPSPLMLGMNLPDDDAWTQSLLTNDEVLAVDQDPLGRQAVRQPRTGLLAGIEIWVKEMADGSRVIGLFNRIKLPMPANIQWASLGLKGPQKVRDLWQRRDMGAFPAGYQATIPPHGAVLLQVTRD